MRISKENNEKKSKKNQAKRTGGKNIASLRAVYEENLRDKKGRKISLSL
jgi:hypothetical protein